MHDRNWYAWCREDANLHPRTFFNGQDQVGGAQCQYLPRVEKISCAPRKLTVQQSQDNVWE